MGWLEILNAFLNLRIVQYALLVTLVFTLAMGVWLEVKVETLKVEKAYYETAYAKVSSGLATQNEAVEQLGEKTKQQEENLKQAANTASKIAVENAKVLQGILSHRLTGTCDEKVTEALEMVRGK